MALAAGTRLGTYEILGPLGSGGMGEVYRARDETLSREVAIKVLPERAAGDPEMRARFEREAQAVARLSHPNILAIHDFGIDQGVLYAVTELLEGETLRQHLDRSPFPWRRTLQIGAEVAEGLAAAHAKGVIHRDLKPANLFLTSDGHVKILDFGLAQVAPAPASENEETATRGLTQSGTTLGTVGYMSPEQVRSSRVDARTDIFSLGSVLYEMISGRRAFARPTAAETMAAILNEDPPDLQDTGKSVPAEVSQLLAHCLAKDPEQRFQSARDVAYALTAVAAGSGAPMTRDAARRNRRRLWYAAIASVLALSTVVAFVWTRSRDRPSPKPAANPRRVLVVPFKNQTGEQSLDSLSTMAADWVGQGLAQTEVVEVVPPGSGLASEDTAGAGTIVSGAYYLQGETLQFRSNVTNTTDGKLLFAIDPVGGPRGNPTEVIESLRQRLMSQIAIHFDPRMQCLRFTRLPSFRAYREYIAGLDLLFRDHPQAMRHFERSVELDPEFVLPRLGVADVYLIQGRPKEASAVVDALTRTRGQFTPYERYLVDFYSADLNGNLGESLRIMRLARKIAPQDFLASYSLGATALALNRPQETVDTFADFDARVYYEWIFASALFSRLAEAHHLLGNYERELAEGRRGRELYPELLTLRLAEVRPLAALGRLAELNQVIEDSLIMMSQDLTPGDVLREAALELAAHGHQQAAREAQSRAVGWHEARVQGKSGNEQLLAKLGDALYLAGRWEKAEGIFKSLVARGGDEVDYQGYLGCLAARRVDRDRAMRISGALERADDPYLHGRHSYWRASIAAILGEPERAVELLQRAFSQGYRYGVHLHRDPALQSLHDYPPFKELLRPKG